MVSDTFKKIFGKDPLSKIFKEYNTILELEEKRIRFQEEYGEQEDITTQGAILKNNFLTLANLFNDTAKKPELRTRFDVPSKSEYFNMQGTPTNIFTSINPKDNFLYEYYHKPTNSTTNIFALEKPNNISSELFSLERKFLSLKSKKIKPIINKIKAKATKRVIDDVISFSNKFKGNEELVKDFILDGCANNNREIFPINIVLERINFINNINNFAKSTEFDLTDSKYFEIKNKDIIVIDLCLFSYNDGDAIVNFMSEFKQLKYDIIFKS